MSAINFEAMLPIESHADQLRRWRNDPSALDMSFTYTQEKTLEEFYPEYCRNYFGMGELLPFFAVIKGERIAALRFDPAEDLSASNRKACEISLIVAPEWRNKGIGVEILREIDSLLIRRGFGLCIAKIKKENLPSQKAFLRAGYVFIRGEEMRLANGQSQHYLRYEKAFSEKQYSQIFVIAEAGSNWRAGPHEKDLQQAYALIEAAKEAGADAVKFQVFRASSTYVENAGMSDYLAFGGIRTEIHDLFQDLEMPDDMVPLLAKHCQSLNIEFMASFFSPRDFELIDPFVRRHKVGSYEITHLRLLQLVGKSKKPLILSTGAATSADIDWAVETFYKNGGENLTLLQCTAKYPAQPHTMNLRVIPWLKNRYQVEVGLSDHSLHPTAASLAAVSLGARVIEKHFTLDRSLPGPDHAFAIEPDELKTLVHAIREVESMLGSEVKEVQPEEEELYNFARRGVQALRDIPKGEILREDVNIAILRPGKRRLGVHSRYLEAMQGRPAIRSIAKGEGVQFSDFRVE